MRVGVDYRILSTGTYLMRRGMGRYTQQQLRAVLEIDSDNDYVLLCPPGADLRLVDPVVLGAPNVSTATMEPTPPAEAGLRGAEEFQSWIAGLGIDLFHATTPFQLTDPVLVGFDACPMVATLYDVIPLLFPDHYLEVSGGRDRYLYAINLVRQAGRQIAISEATRDDAVRHIGLCPDRVDIAYPVAEPLFRPLARAEIDTALRTLNRRMRVPERFALAVSFPHHSKNVDGLLQAYSQLPANLRLELPLVLCCVLTGGLSRQLLDLGLDLGTADDLLVTGLVSDDELAALYNLATFVVHPSRYEGFGLPVVEAMQSGTPVITSTTSSLPEVGGDAALLVDPADVDGLTEAMAMLAGDEALRHAMSEKGLTHAARFDTAQLGRVTLDSYHRAVRGNADAGSDDTVRVALWSPLPPLRSGVADYSADLVDGLGDAAEIEVFVDDGPIPSADILGRQRVQHATAFDRRSAQAPFDAVVYQVGASAYHRYLHEQLCRTGGVVDLHDLVWSYALYSDAVDRGERDAFDRELGELEGPEAVAELTALERQASAGGVDVPDASRSDFWSRYPMLGRLVEASSAQVVHSAAMADDLRRYPTARPMVTPIGVSDPRHRSRAVDVAAVRRSLGVSDTSLVVGTFGIVHHAKGLETCIRVVDDLTRRGCDTTLLAVGAALDPAYANALRTLARSHGVADRVRLAGHLPGPLFDAHLLACDAVVCLRPATTRQVSSTLMRALAAGRAVVASDIADWRDVPDDTCRRIPTGGNERAALTEALAELAADPAARQALGARARAWYEDHATIGRMTARYREVLADACHRAIPEQVPELVAERGRWTAVLEMIDR